MIHRRLPPALLALLLVAPLAHARDVMKETAKQIESALQNNDFIAVRTGFARAKALKDRYAPKKFAVVVKAIGGGIKHKNPKIVYGAIETLGQLQMKGSSRFLSDLLEPPDRIEEEALPLHIAAVKACGEIQDPESTGPLAKLLHHYEMPLATEAAKSLMRYWTLDKKPRLALIRKLVDHLARLEKKAAEAEEEIDRLKADHVRKALLNTMRRLCGTVKVDDAEGVKAWLKKSKKAPAPKDES